MIWWLQIKIGPQDCHWNGWDANALTGLFVTQQQDLIGCHAGLELDSQGEYFNVGVQAIGPV